MDGPTYYLHGTATDQVAKASTRPGPAHFDATPPTETVPDTQTTLVVASDDFPGNGLAAY